MIIIIEYFMLYEVNKRTLSYLNAMNLGWREYNHYIGILYFYIYDENKEALAYLKLHRGCVG